MEDSSRSVVLIIPWRNRRMPDRPLLRELLQDLLDEQISVLPLPPFGPPWIWDEWLDRFPEIDFAEWEYLAHRWRFLYPDYRAWWERYPEWRDALDYILHRLTERAPPRAVILFAPFGEEVGFGVPELRDLERIVKPLVVVHLSVGDADRPLVEQMPDARVLDYPEQRSELLRLLRSLTGERKSLSARHEMAREQFAERTAERERPKITAAYPEVIAPSNWTTVEVFLYLRDYRELVEKEIRRLQDREQIDYSGASSVFPKSLPDGCPIRISLQSDSLRTNPSELSINWYEPYNRLPFRISPKDDAKDGYSASLELDIFADDLPVASMRLGIAVNSTARGERTTPVESDAAWYEDIFASYAREDLKLVKHLKERYEALGLYMFIDLEDLRSGASWQPDLYQKIDSSDLFQLFWSDDARKSKYVTMEWQHALRAREVKGGRFIRPVYWHEPIPAVPDELSEINFRKVNFLER